MTDTTPSIDLVLERTFDAPRELVWRAFTDPDQIAAWFGPVGYSVPRETVEVDLRPGGHQRFTMVSDDDPSVTSPVEGRFVEVVEPELLVTEEHWEGVPGMQDAGLMRARFEFHDEGEGRTRLVIRQGPYSEAMEDMSRQGWESSFTKLDSLLAAA
jgi:uncharacterized protein YndB with AHSA1/START domain